MTHFSRRRERVLAELDEGVMILPAAPQLFGSRDTEVPYRADSEVAYLSGMLDPASVMVLSPDAEEGPFLLFVPARDSTAEQWTGSRLGPDEAKELYQANAAYPMEELETRLPGLIGTTRSVHYRMGRTLEVDRLVAAAFRDARARGARKGTGPRHLLDPGLILDEMRLIKDAEELSFIRDAVKITVDAFRMAMESVRPGIGEWEIQAVLEGRFQASGADGPAFETIVGSGANGCVLHYVRNRDRVGAEDLVLIDAGASMNLYAADITRTVPVGGRFSAVQRALYEVVDAARVAGIQAARVEKPCSDIHDSALGVLTAGLLDLGVLQGSVDEVMESGSYRAFFPHQTSHWLGLDVHDVGDYSSNGASRALEPGMVLTVEPGLYLSPDACGPSVPEEMVGVGIRLEDDVHVTGDGPEILTEALPVSWEAVEDLLA